MFTIRPSNFITFMYSNNLIVLDLTTKMCLLRATSMIVLYGGAGSIYRLRSPG